VTLDKPEGGEKVSLGASYTISWRASDADSAKLFYAVSYSGDGGQSWTPLAIDLEQNSYIWDTYQLPLGNNYKVKVVASDGFNTGESQSASVFAVAEEQNDTNYLLPILVVSVVAVVIAVVLTVIIIKRKRGVHTTLES
jgi:hypothetical protein